MNINEVIGLAFLDISAVIGLAFLDPLEVIGLASLVNTAVIGLAFLGNMEVIGLAIKDTLVVIGLAIQDTLAVIKLGSKDTLGNGAHLQGDPASQDVNVNSYDVWDGDQFRSQRADYGQRDDGPGRDQRRRSRRPCTQNWLASTPLERLRLAAPQPNLEQLGHPQEVRRLEQRATTLLLGAIPDDIKGDLISQRELWPAAIMHKILRTYCPGGWRERTQLLRSWPPQRQQKMLCHRQAPFAYGSVNVLGHWRASTFRMEVHLDERPTDAAVEQYLELIMAEMDYISHSINKLVVPKAINAEEVPFNRHFTKRVQKATAVVLNLFCGPNPTWWEKKMPQGVEIINIDLIAGQDLLHDGLLRYLLQVAKEKRILAYLAGPPCRTVSVLRMRDDNGPRMLRTRSGEHRWGLLPHLKPWEQQQVWSDSQLWLRTLVLARVSKQYNPNMLSMFEQPADPATYMKDLPEELPTFSTWPGLVDTLEGFLALIKILLDQGALGHVCRKPTVCGPTWSQL
eukprot:s1211_g19.t1